MNSIIRHAAFVAGLAALAWIGFVAGKPLALAVTAVIAAVYLGGAAELRRYRRDTELLARAVAELQAAPPDLPAWLATLPQALRQATRRRIEGEPVGFAGPALAPYLAGLLVLLGMLGTFVGMALTLRGTGLALDSAADLQAVRGALAAPVQGLGVAFGTSIAGVATSAALGLMSALARADRARAAQALDARIATTLRGFSPASQREASLALLQRQAELMPALVDTLRSMMEALDRQARESHERLQADQAGFHAKADAAYTKLAASVDRSLRESLGEGARVAGETIRPVVEATLAGIARETAALHATMADTARGQVEQLSTRFDATVESVGAGWRESLARQAKIGEEMAGRHERALVAATGAFDQHSAALLRNVDQISSRFEATVGHVGAAWQSALAEQARLGDGVAERHERALVAAAGSIEQQSAAMLRGVEAVSTRFEATVDQLGANWDQALAQQARVGDEMAARNERAMVAATGAFEQHSAALLRGVDEARAAQSAAADARDEARGAAMAKSLEGLAASLREEWQRAGTEALQRQERLAESIVQGTHELAEQVQAHARGTLAEIGQLMQAAAEAPRVAAEVIVELRAKLADSIARDNSLLEERGRMLETLGTLLDGVNHAAVEQRGAIDALVESSASMLERVGQRFGEQVDADTGRLAVATEQVEASAGQVASLGEAFGAATRQFGESNEALVGQLQRIEEALGKSLERSDEQLAYYVAQAREVVDLSILSQRQILENLQRLPTEAAP